MAADDFFRGGWTGHTCPGYASSANRDPNPSNALSAPAPVEGSSAPSALP